MNEEVGVTLDIQGLTVVFAVAVGAGAIAAVSGFGIGSLITPLRRRDTPALPGTQGVVLPHTLSLPGPG